MENVMKELGAKKVIDRQDILKLREYIEKKYVDYTKKEKLAVLNRAVHQVLDKSIEGLETEYKHEIKIQVLRNTISGETDTTSLADIFKTYISLEGKSENYANTLVKWTSLHIKNDDSKAELELFHKNNNTREITLEEVVSDNLLKNEALSEVTYNSAQNIKIANKTIVKILNQKKIFLSFLTITIITVGIISIYNINNRRIKAHLENSSIENSIRNEDVNSEIKSDLWKESNLPEDFKYKNINKDKLKEILNGKNSLLAEEPYFTTIITVSKEYNLNPLILFAVSGQEQGFVPKDEADANKIANNPFNVYTSWKNYNTDIRDASKIACVTIINLCKDRPKNEDAFKWINTKYSEDKNWFIGVNQIYIDLKKELNVK
ncbi:hypothetical protein [Clostridium sp. 'White wine YQ']|uniref:hypothetical protein n=1 Tax=Clostridium sp. 'White wine YQ' TaxID=3027474 RepID=UPI0023664014|nr:hypothetical protein [Clostridium sp. 'White wine YQ']MDD7794727.1 hypothetical protein [Clostridium sp. 'White wine YQ']